MEELLHKLRSDEVSVDKIIRLGKRLDEVDAKPRPIKAVLASEDQKNKVLQQSKNLKNIRDGDWHKVFIHQDLTTKQREEQKKAVQEIKDRQLKGETNLMVVNGRVVVRKPKAPSSMQTPVDPQM